MLSTKTLTVQTIADSELLFAREFDAPRATVFEALTRPALVQRWLLGPDGWTMPICEIDLKPGGTFRYVWRKGGKDMVMSGTFREIVPPGRIVHTERFDDDWTGGEAVVTTTLTETGRRTLMTLNVRYASAAGCEAALETGMIDGMSATYDRLAEMIARGEIGGAGD
ncbi:MAG TPA: SRPBCC family protein [Vicinamibacterales bacterium]|nr:SRPBCC family protein [Vicinamibacterales bacterium]